MDKGTSAKAFNRHGWYVVAVLFVITMFSQFDRQLTALLVQPLKQAFSINDTQFSLLHGYAFAITYSLLGVPFGRLVDRSNRRNLILIGMLVWSTTTVLAAFARTYPELLLARMGVGVGEAVLAPAAYSMIADLFDAQKRGRAIGIYYVSLAVGSGASFALGGLLLRAIPRSGVALPGGMVLSTWQAVFFYAGLPGFVIALLLLTVREPARREVRAEARATVGEFLTYVWVRRSTFFRLFAIPALLAVAGYGTLGWAPAFFQRRFGMAPAQLGPMLGLLVMAGGVIGPPFAGWLSDRLIARGVTGARLRVILLACCVLAPATLWPLMPTPGLCLGLLAVALVALASAQSAMPVVLQDTVFNDMRGQLVALYLLISGLVGVGFGPTSVALLTDKVFRSEAMLPWSLVVVCLPAAVISAWISLSGVGPYQRARNERWQSV